jgi:hypothetical protein
MIYDIIVTRLDIQTGSGDHPAAYPVGIRILSTEVRWPGHEAHHSPPSSAQVNA